MNAALRTALVLLAAVLCAPAVGAPKEPIRMNVWPGLAPGETTSDPGRVAQEPSHVVALTDVTRPELTLYPVDDARAHPAVLVCPGGGYTILATDLEGSEIARWLNTQGFAAAVLHYRVPGKRDAAFQDAQRAMSLMRANARKWKLDPHRIGVMGFSAGAHLSARLAAGYARRAYSPIDGVDQTSCRPDFVVLGYPAYLTDGPGHTVSPEVRPHAGMPPVFMEQTQDDPILCAPGYAQALDAVGVANQCAMYEQGGHGYGLRLTPDQPVHAWSEEAAAFLKVVAAYPPATHLLWPDGAPGAMGTDAADRPTYTVYLPDHDKATRAAVVVCPGGGYHALMMSYEGNDIARWLVRHGVAAIVLKYRVDPYPPAVSIADGRRAVRTVRAHAKEWGIDPKRVGMTGFSAGGHLASSVGTAFDAGDPTAADPVERTSCRPDFLALVYPSTTIGSGTPTDEQVTKDTPPTFLVHSVTDQIVPVEESRRFHAALQRCGVATEYLELPRGAHGLGCGQGELWAQWQARCIEWLSGRGLARR